MHLTEYRSILKYCFYNNISNINEEIVDILIDYCTEILDMPVPARDSHSLKYSVPREGIIFTIHYNPSVEQTL